MKIALIEETYPLSPMQQGMLFHSLFARDSGVDVEQIVGRLREQLDVDAFRKAWRQLVARHATLRSSFRWEGLDQPLQNVHRDVELPFEIQDWRDSSPEEQARRLEQYLSDDRQAGFSLDQPPAMRVALFQLADCEFNLVWTVHHILLDGRAFPIVLQEAFEYYEANRKNRDLNLAPPHVYSKYIEWLRTRDTSGDETFWRNELAGFTPQTSLTLPGGSSHGNGRPIGRAERGLRLTERQTSVLRSAAESQKITLNTLVQGGWALLLSRYSGEEDVVFGATRACRKSTVPNAESIVGTFINTVPMRVQVDSEIAIAEWLKKLRQQQVEIRGYEHTPLVNIQKWSDVSADTRLFESIIVFDHGQLNTALRSLGTAWGSRELWLVEKTGYPITLYAYADSELLLKINYERSRFSDDQIGLVLGHLENVLERLAAAPAAKLSSVSLLTARERRQLLTEWNDNDLSFPRDKLIHEMFEAWVKRTPETVAVSAQGRQLTYAELNAKANQLAHYLMRQGVGPEVLVGISLGRSLDLMIGLLAIHKAGAAYVPMDPSYPKERLAVMLEDARLAIVLAGENVVSSLPQPRPPLVLLDVDAEAIARESEENPVRRGTPDDLAYVMYTSGSTGKPKGVMVEHRNVVNFFAGMDQRIGAEPSGVWLAVTSLSFDISVFELLWTLARGFTVVLYAGDEHALGAQGSAAPVPEPYVKKEVEFSLFYFASEEGERAQDKYKLLLEGAKFADENGFSAVWTPERHFHAFGGLYPNPSVVSAALAVMTKQIKLRAGSVVIPLHHPIRIAEEWALVDNLSRGRVGISFASGWQPNDFVLAPHNYADRRDLMLHGIETVRRLWRGEAVAMAGPKGEEVSVTTLPRPVQAELPVWLTAAGNPETYRQAGQAGANLLTHLLGQSVEELAGKVHIYREARREYGPGEGHVTLMLHTFVGENDDEVRELVRGPMKEYLKSALDLVKKAAWQFPVNKERDGKADKRLVELAASNDLSAEDMEALLEHAFERYYETSGLFGTPETCADLVDRLKEIGIDEIACLIDFGVDSEKVLASLKHLNSLRERCSVAIPFMEDASTIAALIRDHNVTHLQCTPSMARMLLLDPDSKTMLGRLRKLMIGGEAFPPGLAKEIKDSVHGDILNMYGPTETTIWSCTQALGDVQDTVPIGRPIANTTCYVLDKHLRPVPAGIPGELFIGGEGVVRGYLNRPELTSERFIADPFGTRTEARMYRTGDRVCYRVDGTLEFLGRLDNQVKIRGHRIELGEIEAVLSRHPQVREVAVAAKADGSGGSHLIGYVVAVKGSKPGVESLRGFLSERLPEYMVPSIYINLEALPLTPNKKVDRAALPEPDGARPVLEGNFLKARTPIEQQLTEIWTEVLNVKDIGVNDNFFALGGHSLSAVQVTFQTRQAFGIDVPLRIIFQAPTLADLAEKVEALLIEQADAAQLDELLGEIERVTGERSVLNGQAVTSTN